MKGMWINDVHSIRGRHNHMQKTHWTLLNG
jgi:hypothetical protein